MAEIQPTQVLLTDSQADLDALINRARLVANWACNNDYLDQRDQLHMALSHFYAAKSVLGQLSFGPNVTTQSGGK